MSPAPHATVVYKDSADGYEFPIAVYLPRGSTDEDLEANAWAFAEKALTDGDFRPDGQLIFDRIERTCSCCERVRPGAPGAGGAPWLCNECGAA